MSSLGAMMAGECYTIEERDPFPVWSQRARPIETRKRPYDMPVETRWDNWQNGQGSSRHQASYRTGR